MSKRRCIGITGGLGFLGSNLIRALCESNSYELRVLDNCSNAAVHKTSWDANRVHVIEGDIRDSNAAEEFTNGLDAVVHLAAMTRVIDSLVHPMRSVETNVVGTMNVLEACRKNSVPRFVNASTGGAILGDVIPPIDENMLGNPTSPYGASKAAAESFCAVYSNTFDVSCISLRFSNVYGPFCKKKESAVSHFLQKMIKREKMTIYGNGEQTRDFLFVDDLVDGVQKALDSTTTGVVQLASGRPTTINSLLVELEKCSGLKAELSYAPARVGEIEHTHCNVAKAKSVLGWEPKTDLSDGLLATFEYLLSREK